MGKSINTGTTINELMELKRATEMKAESNYQLARKAIENYYDYAMANPELAKKALSVAAEKFNRTYMDYLEQLTRLNEHLMEGLIYASNSALKDCISEITNNSKGDGTRRNRGKAVRLHKGKG
jgi:hypothetical protein